MKTKEEILEIIEGQVLSHEFSLYDKEWNSAVKAILGKVKFYFKNQSLPERSAEEIEDEFILRLLDEFEKLGYDIDTEGPGLPEEEIARWVHGKITELKERSSGYSLEQVKELLRQQRQNCRDAWGKAIIGTMCSDVILDAPEPSLPPTQSDEIDCKDLATKFFGLMKKLPLPDEPIQSISDEEIDKLASLYTAEMIGKLPMDKELIAKIDFKNGFKKALSLTSKEKEEKEEMISMSEYDAAIKEIKSLQEQLKDSERYIRDLNNGLR